MKKPGNLKLVGIGGLGAAATILGLTMLTPGKAPQPKEKAGIEAAGPSRPKAITNDTRSQTRRTIMPAPDTGPTPEKAFEKSELIGHLRAISDLRKENIAANMPTSLIHYFESVGLSPEQVMAKLAAGLNAGDARSFILARSFIEETMVGHPFFYDFNSRAQDASAAGDPADGDPREFGIEEFRDRSQKLEDQIKSKLGIDDDIFEANETAYDLLNAEYRRQRVADKPDSERRGNLDTPNFNFDSEMSSMAHSLSSFARALEDSPDPDRTIKTLLSAMEKSETAFIDMLLETINYWDNPANYTNGERMHGITGDKIASLRNLLYNYFGITVE